MKPKITVETAIDASIEKIWEYWNLPEHITKWCQASTDWHAPRALNDLHEGGTFTTRMESIDGKNGFDFGGTYTSVIEHKRIAYTMHGDDARTVVIEFVPQDMGYKIIETFEAEGENPLEMQKTGWQSILNNFKKYVLSH